MLIWARPFWRRTTPSNVGEERRRVLERIASDQRGVAHFFNQKHEPPPTPGGRAYVSDKGGSAHSPGRVTSGVAVVTWRISWREGSANVTARDMTADFRLWSTACGFSLVLAVGPGCVALGGCPAGPGGARVVRGAALGQWTSFDGQLTLFGVHWQRHGCYAGRGPLP